MTAFLIILAIVAVWVLSLLVQPFGRVLAVPRQGQHPHERPQAQGPEVLAVQGPGAPPAARLPHRPP